LRIPLLPGKVGDIQVLVGVNRILDDIASVGLRELGWMGMAMLQRNAGEYDLRAAEQLSSLFCVESSRFSFCPYERMQRE
jgi:hypothetical protein